LREMERRRLDFHIPESGLILDMGGFCGQWTQTAFNHFGCRVYVMEPIKEFYEKIVQRFQGNDKIVPLNFGLAGENTSTTIYKSLDGSSIFTKNGPSEVIELRNASEFMEEMEISSVDLANVNVEGSEYDILPNLMESGKIEVFKNIQIQFHKNREGYVEKRKAIQESLSQTHTQIWNYEMAWECWRRNV